MASWQVALVDTERQPVTVTADAAVVEAGTLLLTTATAQQQVAVFASGQWCWAADVSALPQPDPAPSDPPVDPPSDPPPDEPTA